MMTTKESNVEIINVASSIYRYDEHSGRECISTTENKKEKEIKVSKKAASYQNEEKTLGTKEKLVLVEVELDR